MPTEALGGPLESQVTIWQVTIAKTQDGPVRAAYAAKRPDRANYEVHYENKTDRNRLVRTI